MTDYRAKAEEIERSNTPLANLYAAFAIYDVIKEVLDHLASRQTPEPASVPPRPDSACVCGSVDDFHLPACYEPSPADVDPDEALAKVIHETERAHMEVEMGAEVESWENASEFTRTVGLISARAAREHIHLTDKRYESDLALFERAEKAEADLARVTEDRDRLWGERDKAQAKADRYDALRADVEKRHKGCRHELKRGTCEHSTEVLEGILTRDDERAGG